MASTPCKAQEATKVLDEWTQHMLQANETDTYQYRKYGSKARTQQRDSTRHYYKCTVAGCDGRKVVEVWNDNHVPPITYQVLEPHIHVPGACPAGVEGPKKKACNNNNKKKDNTAGAAAAAPAKNASPSRAKAAQAAAPVSELVTKSKRASAQNVSNVIALVKGNIHDEDDFMQAPTRVRQAPRAQAAKPDLLSPRTTAIASPPTCSGGPMNSAPGGRSSTPVSSTHMAELGGAQTGEPEDTGGSPYPGHEGVNFDDPRNDVRTWRPEDGTLGLLFHGKESDYTDEYWWRKYGKKSIKGYTDECPRFYWRCTEPGCDIRKHTQSTSDGNTEVFYYGGHNHAVPPPKVVGARAAKRRTPDAEDGEEPPQEQSPRRKVRVRRRGPEWAEAVLLSPQAVAQLSDSNMSGDLSDFEEVSQEEDAGLELPGGEGRCPLFFLACVAAKDPSI